MDRIESALQKCQQAGVPSSSTPPSVPPPRPPRLAPSRDQYHASPTPPPPPPPRSPAPRPSVHAHQNSTNVHAESSTTSHGNLVGGSLELEILAAYQKLERRKISDLVEQRKSLEKQLDNIKKEIETRTKRLNEMESLPSKKKEMESPHSERKAYRRLDFARPLPSSPPSVAPPPNRGTKRENPGVLDNIQKRRSI